MIKANTGKSGTYFFFRQGGIYYQRVAEMKEESAISRCNSFLTICSGIPCSSGYSGLSE